MDDGSKKKRACGEPSSQADGNPGTSCPTYRPYHVTYGQTVMNKIQHPMMMKETRGGDTQNTKIEQATEASNKLINLEATKTKANNQYLTVTIKLFHPLI